MWNNWRLAVGLVVALMPLVAPSEGPGQIQTWAIDTVPSLEIGSGAGGAADEFGLVVAVARTANASIAVLDAFQTGVRLFDALGQHVRDIGQRGDGPGEFQDPIGLVVRGDSLVVLDGIGRRTWLDSNGAVLKTDRFSIEPLCDDDFSAAYGGLLPDASLVVRCQERLFGRVRGEYRQAVHLLRVRRTGEVDTLGFFPADTGRTDPQGIRIPRPYTPRSLLFWSAAEDLVFVANGDSPEIRGFSLTGGIEASVVAPLSTRPVTPRDVEEQTAAGLRISGSENDRRVVGDWFSEMPRRSDTPLIRSILAATRNELWIESWEQEGERSWWLVADLRSQSFARVLAPLRSRLLSVGPDWTLWLWHDEFDVEHLRVHRLQRG